MLAVVYEKAIIKQNATVSKVITNRYAIVSEMVVKVVFVSSKLGIIFSTFIVYNVTHPLITINSKISNKEIQDISFIISFRKFVKKVPIISFRKSL